MTRLFRAVRWLVGLGGLIIGGGLGGTSLEAGGIGPCSVPGTHSTIQDAVADEFCTTVELDAQVYSESVVVARSLGIAGPSGGGAATLQGLLLLVGAETRVVLSDLRVENGCPEGAVQALGGAEVDASRLRAIRSSVLPCPDNVTQIFSDGFESGDASFWSLLVPASSIATSEGSPSSTRR